MEKSPIRQLFDALIESESLVVTFDSERDYQTTKIRLHQIRKEMDSQLESIGEDSVFGDKSICFTKQSPLTYQIHLATLNASARSRFKIISVGAPSNANLSTDLGES